MTLHGVWSSGAPPYPSRGKLRGNGASMGPAVDWVTDGAHGRQHQQKTVRNKWRRDRWPPRHEGIASRASPLQFLSTAAPKAKQVVGGLDRCSGGGGGGGCDSAGTYASITAAVGRIAAGPAEQDAIGEFSDARDGARARNAGISGEQRTGHLQTGTPRWRSYLLVARFFNDSIQLHRAGTSVRGEKEGNYNSIYVYSRMGGGGRR
eukprot:g15462.t1